MTLKRLGLVLLVLFLAVPLSAQNIAGSITGTVKDPQGAVIPSASVTITNDATGLTRQLNTDASGSFVFPQLGPATYTLTVEASGFKKLERRGIVLNASDRLGLADITLEIGTTVETITVQDTLPPIQTLSGERSAAIVAPQVRNLLLNGRNSLELVALAPGVVVTANFQVSSPGGLGGIFINGTRGNQKQVTIDGVSNVDTGSNGTQHVSLNLDAVAEFKILTSNFQPEFGRSGGGIISLVTKAGTREFHGSGYWYHRHEGLNANNWFNNRDAAFRADRQPISRPLYRYNQQGFNVGGPVILPWWKQSREKLFFFFAEEWQRQLVPASRRDITVPTELERQGDFSQTRERGTPVIIRDPQTGQPFPGNRIPRERILSIGQRILNIYPTPNITDPNFNFTSQIPSSYPRRDEVIRVDYAINSRNNLFVRVINDNDVQVLPYGTFASGLNFPKTPMIFGQPGHSGIITWTAIISPTLTNEFIFGPSRNRLTIDPQDDGLSRQKLNLADLQLLFPNADASGLIPNFTWGGVPNAPSTGFNGLPFRNVNNTFDFTDNLTKVWGAHTFKTGVFVQRSRKDQTAFVPINANINFGRDPTNPADSGWAFSNALLGNFRTYEQAQRMANGLYRYTNFEYFLQDNWKVRRGLTLDFGIRFYVVQPQYDASLQTASFNMTAYDRSQIPRFYIPALEGGRRVARDPGTGQTSPAVLIGALVPGTGSFTNGIVRAGEKGYPRGLHRSSGLLFGPRFGFAWDVRGDQRTVVRGGYGIFYDRFQGNPVFDKITNPPTTVRPIIFYGNLGTLGQSQAVLFPPGVNGFALEGDVPTVHSYSLGVQRRLPGDIALDVAYVGTFSRHLMQSRNANYFPYGYAWRPDVQDPTRTPVISPFTGLPDGTTTLPQDLIRPSFPGFATVRFDEFVGTSNYNSLQVGLNRRFAKMLNFGLAYTWSKVLDTADGDTTFTHPFDRRKNDYGPAGFNRTHVLVLNYILDTPSVSKRVAWLNNLAGRTIFDNWQITGITSFVSGSPFTPGFSVAGLGGLNERITGSFSEGARIRVVGNGPLDRGERKLHQWFNQLAFALPTVGSQCCVSGRNYMTGPGINNWNLAIFKNVPLWSSEMTRYIQFRVEMFNVWNHPQFSGINGSAQFNRLAPDAQITNLPIVASGTTTPQIRGFGAVTGARDPRIVQLAIKVFF